ncbi:hypothetical protein ACWFRF_20720 [Nocardia sp. NPDC055165]
MAELTLFALPDEITVTNLPDRERWKLDIGDWTMFVGHTLCPTERAVRALAAGIVAEGADHG